MPAHKRFPDRVRVNVYMNNADREKIREVAYQLNLSVSQLILLATMQVVKDEIAWREAGRRRNQVLGLPSDV